MNEYLIKIFVSLHNFSYKVISFLAIRKNKGLHPKHRILNYHQFFLDHISEQDQVLDIGCGHGPLAYDISQKASEIFAIDIYRPNIEIAKKKFHNENLHYILGDATVYPFTKTFDKIVLSNVLEHIDKRVEFLRSIRGLAPRILIRVPLITRDWLSVYKKEIGCEYRLDLTHFTEYTEEAFQKEIQLAGLEIESAYNKFGELYSVVKTSTT